MAIGVRRGRRGDELLDCRVLLGVTTDISLHSVVRPDPATSAAAAAATASAVYGSALSWITADNGTTPAILTATEQSVALVL